MKEPIALLVNDLHVNKDNVQDFEANWDEVLKICKKHDIAQIIIGGDVFTERSSQTLSVLLSVKKALMLSNQEGIHVLIAEGNHDLVDPESDEGYNHLWRGLSRVEVIDKSKILCWENVDFAVIVMSYLPENGSFLEELDRVTNNAIQWYSLQSKKNIILYIHEGVHGALGDFEIEGELPQEPFLEYKAVLCGHYHNRVKIKNTPIEYIGASRQHNFGEDEEKGYTLLFDDGSYEFVKNQVNTRYRTIEVGWSELDTISLDNRSGYKTKIKLKCNEKDAKLIDKQKLLDMGFNKVEVVVASAKEAEVESVSITEKYDKKGMRQEYRNYCGEAGIDSTLGLKYLED